MVAGFITDTDIFPLSCCVVSTKSLVKLLDAFMQGMVAAA